MSFPWLNKIFHVRVFLQLCNNKRKEDERKGQGATLSENSKEPSNPLLTARRMSQQWGVKGVRVWRVSSVISPE